MSREDRDLLREILDQPDVQEALRQRILDGDAGAYFRAYEIVYGRPRQSPDVNEHTVYVLPAGDDIEGIDPAADAWTAHKVVKGRMQLPPTAPAPNEPSTASYCRRLTPTAKAVP